MVDASLVSPGLPPHVHVGPHNVVCEGLRDDRLFDLACCYVATEEEGEEVNCIFTLRSRDNTFYNSNSKFRLLYTATFTLSYVATEGRN